MTKPAAIAYVRVSTHEQADEGVSLRAQEERIRAYCELAGLDLVGIFREEGVDPAEVTLPTVRPLVAEVHLGDFVRETPSDE